MHLVTLGALRRLGVSSYSQSVGTAALRFQMGAGANQSLLQTFVETTATSGDSRLRNERLYFSGAGVSGEVIRAYGIVNNVTAATGGTVNGAHLTLGVTGASGAISGAANAVRATLSLGASVVSGGTIAAIQADTDFDATATIPATASYLRFTNSNTGKMPILMNLDGVDTNTLYIDAGTSAGSAGDAGNCAAQKVVQIRVNGAAAYIPVFTQNS